MRADTYTRPPVPRARDGRCEICGRFICRVFHLSIQPTEEQLQIQVDDEFASRFLLNETRVDYGFFED